MTNFRLYLMVVAFIGVTLLAGVAGIVVLAVLERPTPDVLQNVTIGALTGLVGLLVQADRSGS